MRDRNKLTELIQEFEQIEDKRQDLNLPLNALVMTDDGKLKNYTYGEFELSPVANKRLCSLYGFSKPHLDVLAEEGHFDLIAEQFNRMMLKDHSVMKFRTVDQRIKGIVSKDYRKYDDYDVFTQVGEYLNDNGYDYELDVMNKNDEYTRVRFMIKDTEKDFGMTYEGQLDNDIVKAGFEITNSEIGGRSMGINSFIYRQVCTNGMMGVMAEDSGEVFHKRGKGFNPFAQRTLLHNGLENSLEKSVNGIYLFKKTKDITVKDPLHEIEKIGKRYSLNRGHVEGVQEAYEHEKQNNLYSVINGFTRYATDNLKKDYKNRAKFETIANDILETVA